MPHHFHAVVWIDHKQARIFHFNVEEADKTVIRDHIVRDIHPREKRTGHRIEENKAFFEDVAKAIAFLIEDDYMSGQTIICDGGLLRAA